MMALRRNSQAAASGLVLLAILGLAGCRMEFIANGAYVQSGRCGTATQARETFILEINAMRAKGGSCGGVNYPPAPPLAWNPLLAQAAAGHAGDMAKFDFISHLGVDGGRVAARLQLTGYRASVTGENLGGGYASADAALEAWLASPSNCSNIYNPAFRDIGGACAERGDAQYVTYWNLVFASP